MRGRRDAIIYMLTHNKSRVEHGFRTYCSLGKNLPDIKKRWMNSDVMVNAEFEPCNCKENRVANLEGLANHLAAADDMWHRSLLIDCLVRGGQCTVAQNDPTNGIRFKKT